MEFLKWKVLAILFVMCAMPVERGNMIKSDVTPAPTFEFKEFIEKKEDFETKYEVEPSSIDDDTDPGVVLVETVEVSSDGKPSKSEESDLMFSTRKKISMPSQPVCKYGIEEIFLFRSLADVSSEGNVSKYGRTETLKHDGVEVGDKETPDGEGITDKPEQKSSVMEKNITVEGEDKSEDGENPVNLVGSQDMQSFEEWKNKKLQEQESRLAESPPIPAHIIRAKKTQVNYASQDCGAKVLAHNKEAKHVSAILDENKDMYMLNPCSTSIWFIIELCEPIQVQQLQLGNLELFSSAPKEFAVSVSERYPAREWHSIGTFEATHERNLQAFVPKGDGQMFAKYIKFDMLSHFSNEHFCPLTLVRVLGVSMVDEFDEPEQLHSIKDGSIEEVGTNKNAVVNDVEGSEGPIDTVLNIVKSAMGHVLSNGGNKDSENKLADAKANDSEEGFDNNDKEAIDPTAESEIVLVTNETEVAGPSENISQSFITLIETGNGEDLTEYLKNLTTCSSKKIPLYIPKFINFLPPGFNINMCWFLEFFCKISLAGCLVHYPYNYSAMGFFLPIANVAHYSTSTDALPDRDAMNDATEDITPLFHKPVLIEGVSEDTVIYPKQESGSAASEQNSINAKHSTEADNTIQLLSEGPRSQGKFTDQKDYTSKPPFPKPDVQSIKEADTKQIYKPSDDNVAISEPSQDSNEKNLEGIDDVNRGAGKSNVSSGKNAIDPLSTGNTTGIRSNDTITKTIEAVEDIITVDVTDNATKPEVDSTMTANPTTTQPPVVINPGTNQKDSVFMRLSNRIRVLEQNMTLSSDYLENLSQRYKKQMDEMQRAFNQTTSKLLTTSRTANENDARQTELIQQAQAEIKLLKQQIHNISLMHEQLNMQLVERHVCLIILEVIVFVAVLVTCLGRRMAEVRSDLQKSEAMLGNLQSIIKDLKLNTPVKANGHCPTNPIDATDHRTASTCLPVVKHSKRQRKRSAQRHKDSIKNGTLSLRQFRPHETSILNVEEIGNKTSNDNMPVKGATDSWNENALAPKIPNGHIKGRK